MKARDEIKRTLDNFAGFLEALSVRLPWGLEECAIEQARISHSVAVSSS